MSGARLLPILLLSLLGRCADEPARPSLPSDTAPDRKPRETKVRRILIDQIVLSFDKPANPAFKNDDRTAAAAEQLAKRLRDRVVAGVEFSALKERYSDARVAGRAEQPFYIFNEGIQPRAMEEYGVVAWKNCFVGLRKVAFGLKPGAIGLAAYHRRNCPQGWFVIKRLQ